MIRGVGRTSPYPCTVLGSVRVPNHGGGTVPRSARCEDDELAEAGVLGEGGDVSGPGVALLMDTVVDDWRGADPDAASSSLPHAGSALASRTPTSVSRLPGGIA
jgi:hypothetical protein